MAIPMESSFLSLPTGPSRANPTGSPAAVCPAGTVTPGIPVMLPGSAFLMNVPNSSTGGPPLMLSVDEPFTGSMGTAGNGVIGAKIASMSFDAKYASYSAHICGR